MHDIKPAAQLSDWQARAIAAEKKLAELAKLHRNNPRMRCGARSVEEVRHYSGREAGASLVCTREPGHDGAHRDAICCWRFHPFTDGKPSPEDVWGGRGCTCGTLGCDVREILEEQDDADA